MLLFLNYILDTGVNAWLFVLLCPKACHVLFFSTCLMAKSIMPSSTVHAVCLLPLLRNCSQTIFRFITAFLDITEEGPDMVGLWLQATNTSI